MMTCSTWIFYLFVAFVKPGGKTTRNALIFAIIYFLELQFAMEYCQGGRLSWTGRVPKVISERDLELLIARQECISEVTYLF